MNDDKKNEIFAIPLTNSIVNKLDIKEEQVSLNVESNKLVVIFKDKEKQSHISLIWMLIPALIVSIIFFIFFMLNNKNQILLTGDLSIATFTITLGLLSGMISFIYFFIKERNNENNIKDIYWRNFPTIVISFVLIQFFVLTLFFRLLDQVFFQISFDLYTSTGILFMFIGIINYVMIFLAKSINPKLLTDVFTIVIVGGVLAAIITNTEQQWWQHNLSFLGGIEAVRSWQFNLTLIFSGLFMIGLIDYLFVLLMRNIGSLKRLYNLKLILILIALSLAGVGLFPYNNIPFFQKTHNLMAGLLVVFIIVLIFSLKYLLPELAKSFIKLSYIVMIGLVIAIILFLVVGYLSLTAFQLISFTLAFSWLLLFLSEIQNLISCTYNDNETKIIKL